jgi:hypothetical protein
MNALDKLLALAALGLMVFPGAAPAQPGPRGPNIMIIGTDIDKDAIPRGHPAFDRIQGVIADQLRARGLHVFDETAIPKDALPQSGVPREPSELVDTAKLARVPIDVIVVPQISARVRPMRTVADTYKPSIRVSVRMMRAGSGELVGRYDYGDDIDFPPLSGSCATSRDCLLEVFGSEAQLIGLAVGNAVATYLAADVRAR